MPLQNRVDPFGAVHAWPARGTAMGNRGIIHDPVTRTLLKRRWTTRAWIVCLCAFKERHRRVMAPGSYTELFFLDEVTALAAGHRPCFECQRERAKDFARDFAAAIGNGQPMQAGAIDAVLHRERLAAGHAGEPLTAAALRTLPDGTVVARQGQAFALRGGHLLFWHPEGYRSVKPERGSGWSLVTPPSTVDALRAGFRARFHESVGALSVA